MTCAKAYRITVPVFIFSITLFNCKAKQPGARLKDVENTRTYSTDETLNYISQNIETQSWKWEVDHKAYNRKITSGAKLRNSKELFMAPYKDIQICDDDARIEIGGEPACLTIDNAMRYDYLNDRILPDSKRYNHIIPQERGENQTEMLKYMQEGDLIVYFHPERRGGVLGTDGMQWRATHAATIVLKDSKLTTADTPAGYAQPFTGDDPTPFHVFRFMPKDEHGNELPEPIAQKYRSMIAKWATLGFDQFDFNGNYNSAAGKLRNEESVKEFRDQYLKSAMNDSGTIPEMYCSWFVFTNLSLAWMHPMNEAGLSGAPISLNPNENFRNIKRGFAYHSSTKIGDYLDNHPELTRNQKFPFYPMTGYELLNGFLVRIVGPDSKTDPMAFVKVAKQKAEILQGLSQDEGILATLRSRQGMVPNYDNEISGQLNVKMPSMMVEFAGHYRNFAEKVQSGEVTPAQAVEKLQGRFKMITAEKDAVYSQRDNSKRWLPPYIYTYIAEKYDLRSEYKPVLAYIGTVINRDFLKPAGSESNGDRVVVSPGIAMKPLDKILDNKMYEILGHAPREDGKGYIHFFECLADENRRGCGDKIKRHFTEYEIDALRTYANDWVYHEGGLTLLGVETRNNFGLDAVRFRRLLASYWNNPVDAFRPNIFEDPSAGIAGNIINFRILMNSPIALADRQAAASAYVANNRVTPMPCIPETTKLPQNHSCHIYVPLTDERREASGFLAESDSKDGDHGDWPLNKPEPLSGSTENSDRSQQSNSQTSDDSSNESSNNVNTSSNANSSQNSSSEISNSASVASNSGLTTGGENQAENSTNEINGQYNSGEGQNSSQNNNASNQSQQTSVHTNDSNSNNGNPGPSDHNMNNNMGSSDSQPKDGGADRNGVVSQNSGQNSGGTNSTDDRQQEIETPDPSSIDSDNDTIKDSHDLCTRSEREAEVWTDGEWAGCAEGQMRDQADSDGDLIINQHDNCRSTRANVAVWRHSSWLGCAEGQIKDRN